MVPKPPYDICRYNSRALLSVVEIPKKIATQTHVGQGSFLILREVTSDPRHPVIVIAIKAWSNMKTFSTQKDVRTRMGALGLLSDRPIMDEAFEDICVVAVHGSFTDQVWRRSDYCCAALRNRGVISSRHYNASICPDESLQCRPFGAGSSSKSSYALSIMIALNCCKRSRMERIDKIFHRESSPRRC